MPEFKMPSENAKNTVWAIMTMVNHEYVHASNEQSDDILNVHCSCGWIGHVEIPDLGLIRDGNDPTDLSKSWDEIMDEARETVPMYVELIKIQGEPHHKLHADYWKSVQKHLEETWDD